MQIRSMVLGSCLTIGALGAAAGVAQNFNGHPNLVAARDYGVQAYQALVRAQQANHFDLGGHAQKAKDLLEQANHELDQAVAAANHRR